MLRQSQVTFLNLQKIINSMQWQRLRLLGLVWMVGSSIDLELFELALAQNVSWQHAPHRVLDDSLGVRCSNFSN